MHWTVLPESEDLDWLFALTRTTTWPWASYLKSRGCFKSYKSAISWGCYLPAFALFCSVFWPHKFPGQGSNLSHSSDNARSLACWTTGELLPALDLAWNRSLHCQRIMVFVPASHCFLISSELYLGRIECMVMDARTTDTHTYFLVHRMRTGCCSRCRGWNQGNKLSLDQDGDEWEKTFPCSLEFNVLEVECKKMV